MEFIAPTGNNEVPYDPFDISSLCNHFQEVDCRMNKSGKQLLTQFQKDRQANHSALHNPASLLHLAIDPQALIVICASRNAVIFDTVASLAITPDKQDFDGPLTIPEGDLQLGGTANGLQIEGVGPVTWTFSNDDGSEVAIRSMAYYVPNAKARLLNPQRLFDADVQGHYEGDGNSFRLFLKNNTL